MACPDTYGSLVTYAAEAGVPVILDAGGEELKHAVGYGPDLVVAETSSADSRPRPRPDPAGCGRGGLAGGGLIRAVAATGEWTARVDPRMRPRPVDPPAFRGALVAGLAPGQLLGWSWPDRLRHALALATGGAGAWTKAPGAPQD